MKAINRYFRNDAKSLIIEIEISKLQREIRKLRREQRALFVKMHKDNVEIRQMFNDRVFDSYSTMCNIWVMKLKKIN